MRYILKLSYNGGDFNGWQSQPNAPSVQETLEDALSKLLEPGVKVTGAGRTDTGVNAVGYIAHFDTGRDIDCAHLCCKLNAILPPSICICGVAPTESGFHARFDATKREYTYFLHRVKNPFIQNFSYFYPYRQLDIEEMNRAAKMLLGTHDFSCFEKTGADNKTSICTVTEAEWQFYTPLIDCDRVLENGSGTNGNYLYFKISANRFLRNMVRAVVGTLLDVGRGRRSAESIQALLKSGNRCAAGESVPGHALFLSGIDY